ncbi:hypothetical protein VTN77DRAFT_9137 [Rasamsonia byssochlamydoides]|uniref:uncharacterized protein n=1 Tax=Rasamsonia byssochlamydoides TaxID=89139 RepID=UPI0037434DF5
MQRTDCLARFGKISVESLRSRSGRRVAELEAAVQQFMRDGDLMNASRTSVQSLLGYRCDQIFCLQRSNFLLERREQCQLVGNVRHALLSVCEKFSSGWMNCGGMSAGIRACLTRARSSMTVEYWRPFFFLVAVLFLFSALNMRGLKEEGVMSRPKW